MAGIRYWNDTHLEIGFSYIDNEGIQEPLCLLCDKKFANSYMRINKMKRHMEANHSLSTITFETLKVIFLLAHDYFFFTYMPFQEKHDVLHPELAEIHDQMEIDEDLELTEAQKRSRLQNLLAMKATYYIGKGNLEKLFCFIYRQKSFECIFKEKPGVYINFRGKNS